jgi:septal ring factor EnvC (AmiA/AmiB activator)
VIIMRATMRTSGSLALLAALALAVGCDLGRHDDGDASPQYAAISDFNTLNESVQQAQLRQSTAEQRQQAAEQRSAQVEQRLAAMEQRVGSLTQSLTAVSQQNAALQQQLAQTQLELRATQEQVARMQSLANRARRAVRDYQNQGY